MKSQLATTLTEGQSVDCVFLIRCRELRSTRYGEAYLALELADRSGAIPAVMFRPPQLAESIPVGTVVRARGTVTSFRGVKRVSLEDIRPAEQYDISDLLPRSTRERSEAVAALRLLARSISDPGLRRLVSSVFADKELFRKFVTVPASVDENHVHLGGLLDHTVAVATACRGFLATRSEVDGDLLVAAALLHDIGVVDAIGIRAGFELTTEGRMLGHAVLGERRIAAALEGLHGVIGSKTASHVSHLVLSHHGSGAGCVAEPCSLEALILSRLDALDRQADMFTAAVRGAVRVEEDWTDAANRFGRPLYAAASARLRSV